VIGASAGEAHSLQRLAELRIAQGDRASAQQLLQRALPLARWSPIALHLLQRIHGTTIRAATTAEEAHAAAERAEATVGPEDHCGLCQIMVSVPSAIACADVGDVEGAQRHLRTADESAALWHGTAWQAALLEARAHLARATGEETRWDQLLRQAAQWFQDAGQPLDADRCRTDLAAPVHDLHVHAGPRTPI
jgi:hypothetical protein